MAFIRVIDKDTKHEYDAPAALVDLNPDLYTVVDDEEVAQPRPAVYYSPKKRGNSVGEKTEGEG